MWFVDRLLLYWEVKWTGQSGDRHDEWTGHTGRFIHFWFKGAQQLVFLKKSFLYSGQFVMDVYEKTWNHSAFFFLSPNSLAVMLWKKHYGWRWTKRSFSSRCIFTHSVCGASDRTSHCAHSCISFFYFCAAGISISAARRKEWERAWKSILLRLCFTLLGSKGKEDHIQEGQEGEEDAVL